MDVFKLKYRDNKEQKALTEKENQKMCMTFGKKKKRCCGSFMMLIRKNLSKKGQEKNLLGRKFRLNE